MGDEPGAEKDALMEDRKPIENERELEFAVFCIENVAARLGKSSDAVYRALTGKGDILTNTSYPAMSLCIRRGGITS